MMSVSDIEKTHHVQRMLIDSSARRRLNVWLSDEQRIVPAGGWSYRGQRAVLGWDCGKWLPALAQERAMDFELTHCGRYGYEAVIRVGALAKCVFGDD